jgi:hypothetical protein
MFYLGWIVGLLMGMALAVLLDKVFTGRNK